MCVKLQHYTNTNLAEAMALQYPKYVRWMFWVIAEVSIILTDLPEVIGFAIAIHLFNPSVPLYAGVLLSFLTTMLFLATLHKGSYFIELTACALVVIMSIVLFVEWDMSPTNSEDFLKGAFLPILPMTPGAIQSIIQIIGAVVMPHNLYLHSGALETRRCPPVDAYKRQAVKLGLWDPFIPILSTTVVNWAIASLAAIYVYGKNIPDADGLGIASFPKYLDVKGGTIMWGIALIAAAQSSCITTTYSGQFVMDGFLKINIPKWSRAIITRCVAVVPCVAVAAAFTNDTKALETMVDIVNSSLAFLLPFALIPLVKLTCSKQYMGEDYVAGKIETVVISLATLLCFGINFYTLVAPGGDYFGQYTSDMNIVGVQMNIVQDIVCIFYTACCVYMTFVPVRGSPLPIRKSLKPVDEEEEHAVAATDSLLLIGHAICCSNCMLFFFVHRLQRFPDWKRGSPDRNECLVYTAGRIENTHNVLDNVHLHTNDVHIGCVLAKIVATRGHEGIEVDTKAEKSGKRNDHSLNLTGYVVLSHILLAACELYERNESKWEQKCQG